MVTPTLSIDQGCVLITCSIVQQSRRFLHMTRTMLAEKSISPSFNIQSAAEKFNLSPNVFTQALTHKSYKHGKVPSNERLQYLGRRSLEFFAVEANKTKSVEELQKAVRNATADRKLVSTFDSLSLEGGVQCHLVNTENLNFIFLLLILC